METDQSPSSYMLVTEQLRDLVSLRDDRSTWTVSFNSRTLQSCCNHVDVDVSLTMTLSHFQEPLKQRLNEQELQLLV